MKPEDASALAILHREGIKTGFLSTLGERFLRALYQAIPACSVGFGYVWAEADGTVLGFIACSEDTARLYKQVLRRRFFSLALALARFALRPSIIRRCFATLLYPRSTASTETALPKAEVLSIAVSEEARGKGVGKVLMAAALEELARRGIPSVRVAVWDGNSVANKYYVRSGYHLATTKTHHGKGMNIYVREIQSSRHDAPEDSPSD